MTELELLVDLHKNTYRQGPGDDKITETILSFCNFPSNSKLKVADIGCGTGASSQVLANILSADITAIDLFPEFLDQLKLNISDNKSQSKITTEVVSMDTLNFETESLDLIWSEGAIYNIGFENGIDYWKKFLKPGGYTAVSEISWISDTRPKEIEKYWQSEYPQIDTVSNKIKVLENSRFKPIAHVILPTKAWIDNYYTPLENNFENFLKRYQHSETAKEIVRMNQQEIKLYKKYQEFYSYGFYLAQKI